MTENYIVLEGKRYDILTDEDTNCSEQPECEHCPLNGKCLGNIIDIIDDTLGVVCEDEVILIEHKENG